MFGSDEFKIAGKIISDLRDKPPPVNRVRGTEFDAEFFEFVADFFVAENFFYAGLRVVKISSDRRDVYIAADLRDHLQSLNFADAAVGIENHDFSLRHVRETGQRRLAGVTGSRHED